ncbi:MAG: heavy metal translocating P-type ATPase [Flavisolibacter sp.]
MEKVQWKVEGMSCANCALTINKYLENSGAQNVAVNAISGDVSFDVVEATPTEKFAKGIESLGYKVVNGKAQEGSKKSFLSTNLQRFWFCLPFTAVLLLHMIPGLHLHWLMNPWLQMALALPVFIVGMRFFGRSAIKSLRNGVPNMNVLITLGALAAFIYSLTGAIFSLGENYLFFETTATIITLVFLGNYLEDASVQSTQRSLKALVKSQKVMANMIAFDDQHQEVVFPVENTQLRNGDLLLIRTGEQVPADCKILWGEGHFNEALLTGEPKPVRKEKKDFIVGGSILEDGTVKAQVTAAGGETVLSRIIDMVKKAQGEKPPMQQLADRISAIFVPVVVGIAVITFAANWFVLKEVAPALMRSIAVLVIACPCAMGLATPAAIAVGLGRGARNGILFRNARSLELFKDIQQVVFDKTGTLTTGRFHITAFESAALPEEEFKRLVFSLEKYSTHPLARRITEEWKTTNLVRWSKVEEVKGQGVKAVDKEGSEYFIGSAKALGITANENVHSSYVTKNGELLGWIDLKDELRPEAMSVLNYLHAKKIKTILLSGDRLENCRQIADELGIDEVYAEQSPEEKMKAVETLSQRVPTAMIGDGINDAPALAKATIGISMSEASQMAMQTAQVVLMSNDLQKLPEALGLGRHTYGTIRGNLFWAFSYNIIAIPIAALGFLSPAVAALAMGFSDVVLAANSVRLFVKKVV